MQWLTAGGESVLGGSCSPMFWGSGFPRYLIALFFLHRHFCSPGYNLWPLSWWWPIFVKQPPIVPGPTWLLPTWRVLPPVPPSCIFFFLCFSLIADYATRLMFYFLFIFSLFVFSAAMFWCVHLSGPGYCEALTPVVLGGGLHPRSARKICMTAQPHGTLPRQTMLIYFAVTS